MATETTPTNWIQEWLSKQEKAGSGGSKWTAWNKKPWSELNNYFTVAAVQHHKSPEQIMLSHSLIRTHTPFESQALWVVRLILRAGGTYVAVIYDPESKKFTNHTLPFSKPFRTVRLLSVEECVQITVDYDKWEKKYIAYCNNVKRPRSRPVEEDDNMNTDEEDEFQTNERSNTKKQRSEQLVPEVVNAILMPNPEDFSKRYLQLLSQKSMLTTQLLQLEIDLVRLLEEQKQYFNNL
jgi:hypothetical protein